MERIKNPYVLAALALLAIFAIWTFWPKDNLEVGQSVALPQAKETAKAVPDKVRVEYIYVYPKAKKDLNLPEPVQQDAAKQVTTTAKLKAEERGYTLSSVIDTETGTSEIYARPEPLPWVGPGRGGKIGVAYGLKNNEPTGRLYASHDLIQVKALHGGAMGTLDTDREWFGGGYIEYRF